MEAAHTSPSGYEGEGHGAPRPSLKALLSLNLHRYQSGSTQKPALLGLRRLHFLCVAASAIGHRIELSPQPRLTSWRPRKARPSSHRLVHVVTSPHSQVGFGYSESHH